MAKKSTAWFPFYVDDWHGGTKHLSLEERACYLELLLYQHANGYIPAEPLVRMNLCGVRDIGQWERIWRHLEDKFEVIDDDGRRANPRMLVERERSKLLLEKRRRGGQTRAAQKRDNPSPTPPMEEKSRSASSSPSRSADSSPAYNHNHNHKTPPSSSSTKRDDDEDDEVVKLGEEDWRVIREWANKVRRAKPNLPRDWVWQMLVLAAQIERGVPRDIGAKIVSGEVVKPIQYAEKTLRDYLGINTPQLRERLTRIPVPEPTTETEHVRQIR